MRSGTSSLAGSLKILGLHVPQPEVPGVAAQPEGPLRAALGDPVPQAAAARGAHPAERRQPRGRAADRRRRRRRWDGAGARRAGCATRPSRGSSSRTRTPPGWSARGRRRPARPQRDLRLLTAIRHPAEVVGSQDLTWGHRRDDAMRRVKETSNVAAWLNVALVTERAGPRPAALVHPLQRADRGLADRARPRLDPAVARPRHRPRTRGPRARRVARPVAAPLAGLVGRPRGAVLAARPRRGRLGPAQPPGRRPAGRSRDDPPRRDPRRVRRRYAEGVALTLDEARHRERVGAQDAAGEVPAAGAEARTPCGACRRRGRAATPFAAGAGHAEAGPRLSDAVPVGPLLVVPLLDDHEVVVAVHRGDPAVGVRRLVVVVEELDPVQAVDEVLDKAIVVVGSWRSSCRPTRGQ